jgi:hypothetical protein
MDRKYSDHHPLTQGYSRRTRRERVTHGWLYPARFCCRLKALDLQPPCCRASIRPRQMQLNRRHTYRSTCRAHFLGPAFDDHTQLYLTHSDFCPREFHFPLSSFLGLTYSKTLFIFVLGLGSVMRNLGKRKDNAHAQDSKTAGTDQQIRKRRRDPLQVALSGTPPTS